MASIKTSLGAASGEWVMTSLPAGVQTIAAGATGNILTIPAVAGKKARLIMLHSAGTVQPNISITTDKGVVVSSLSLNSTASSLITAGTFFIGVSDTSGRQSSPIRHVESSTSIVVSAAAATVAAIYYMYTYGE